MATMENMSYLGVCKQFNVAGIKFMVGWEPSKIRNWTGKLGSDNETCHLKGNGKSQRIFCKGEWHQIYTIKVNLPLVRIKGKAGKLAKNEHSGTKREIMRLWSDTMTREDEEKGRHWRQNSVQFSSVTQSCPTLCDPRNRSMPGLPVHHQLPEFTQTHVHWVGNAIQPSHPLPSPSPPAPNSSQHQSLLQWVNSSHEVAKVLEFQL